MKKIKKLALLLAICMVGTVGLVGCGNDGGSSSKNEVQHHRLLTTMQTVQMTAPLIQKTAIHRQAW